MGARDVKSNIKVAQLFTKIQRTASATIQGTEVADFGGACFVVDIGAHSADDMSITFQESDDNSSWSNIAAANLDGDQSLEIVAAHANTVRYTGYKGNKKYIGAIITDGGTGDAVFGVSVVAAYPTVGPKNS